MKNKLLFFGVLFACLIALTPVAYAKENELPHYPSVNAKYKYYYAIRDDNADGTSHTQLFIIHSDNDIDDFKCVLNDKGLNFTSSKMFGVFTYYLDDNNKWAYYNLTNGKEQTRSFYDSTILVHNDTPVYDDNGVILFRKSGETMNSVIQELSTNSLREHLSLLGSPLRVLLVVGLGIMAIFIGIGLIPRIIHKFL